MTKITNMYELQKYVLESIIDNEILFKKELQKSKKYLSNSEFSKLQEWLNNTYDIQPSVYLKEFAS